MIEVSAVALAAHPFLRGMSGDQLGVLAEAACDVRFPARHRLFKDAGNATRFWLIQSDPRYQGLPPDALPRAESLADVTARLLPYWYDAIVPDLRAGGCVLVVSHNNTLRALVKHLEAIPDAQIAELEIPTGIPLAYQLGPDLRPMP